MKNNFLAVLVGAASLLGGAAHAQDAAAKEETKCLAGRAKAQGVYQACVQNWVSAVQTKGTVDTVKLQKQLSNCRMKYAAAWTKLNKLSLSQTCSGSRFTDNGSTVTDKLTGLVWEKKTTEVGSGTSTDRRDVDNFYTLKTGATLAENGTAYTDFLATLNSDGGFDGSNGWRLPTFAELQTLIAQAYPCTDSPCINAIFGPTSNNDYFSSTTYAGRSVSSVGPGFPPIYGEYNARTWTVQFFDGYATGYGKDASTISVRAVRGGQ